MLNCGKINNLLDDFLGGDLSPKRAEAVKRHVASCPSCRQELLKKSSPASSGHHSQPSPSGDWLDVAGRKLSREGPWQEILRPMLLPWEKKIPLLVAAIAVITVIVFSLCQLGCEFKPEEKTSPSPAFTPAPSPRLTPVAEAAPAKLRRSRMSSVLVLDEPEEAAGKPAGPPSSRAFQDQQAKLYVQEVSSALKKAVDLTLASGGQLISYPIKGFENMGPHERILIFPLVQYRNFLARLQTLGRVEHPPLISSDYVTVRLTVLREGSSPTPVPGPLSDS